MGIIVFITIIIHQKHKCIFTNGGGASKVQTQTTMKTSKHENSI